MKRINKMFCFTVALLAIQSVAVAQDLGNKSDCNAKYTACRDKCLDQADPIDMRFAFCWNRYLPGCRKECQNADRVEELTCTFQCIHQRLAEDPTCPDSIDAGNEFYAACIGTCLDDLRECRGEKEKPKKSNDKE